MENGLKSKAVDSKNKNIFLTGFMGCGKTTVGKALGNLLQKEFYDLDHFIQVSVGESVSDIINNRGIEYFRQVESEVLHDISKKQGAVIALGGGSLMDSKNQTAVKQSGILVYLMADEMTLMKRLEGSYQRPLLQLDSYENLLSERNKGYMSAELIIRTDAIKPEDLARMIQSEVVNL